MPRVASRPPHVFRPRQRSGDASCRKVPGAPTVPLSGALMLDDIDPNEIICRIRNSGGTVIRGFRSRDDLISAMQAAVDDGIQCAFAPTLKTLRAFLNTDGFVSVMDEVNAHLQGHEVLVEARCYDSQHLFAVAPRA